MTLNCQLLWIIYVAPPHWKRTKWRSYCISKLLNLSSSSFPLGQLTIFGIFNVKTNAYHDIIYFPISFTQPIRRPLSREVYQHLLSRPSLFSPFSFLSFFLNVECHIKMQMLKGKDLYNTSLSKNSEQMGSLVRQTFNSIICDQFSLPLSSLNQVWST